jgi:photosystem II stability/assembly factor-like uncharacterized protein
MKRILQFSLIILVLVLGNSGLTQTAPAQASALKNDSTPGTGTPTTGKASSVYEANHPDLPQGIPTTRGTVVPGVWRNMRPTESFLNDVSMLPATNPPTQFSCAADQRSEGWIVGNNGVILGYCNGIWDHFITTESLVTHLWGVTAVTPTLAFAVGIEGTILMYNYDLVAAKDYTWVKQPITASQRTLYRIAVAQNGVDSNNNPRYTAWITGDYNPVYQRATLIKGTITAKTGANSVDPYGHPIYDTLFQDVTSNYLSLPGADLYFGVQAVRANDVWAVGGTATLGTAIHWDGATWTATAVSSAILYGLYFAPTQDGSPSKNGWAVGEGGKIFHYDGSGWTAVNSPVTSTLVDVSFSADGTGWITGFDGVLLRYKNGVWSNFTDIRTDYWDYYALDHTSGHGWMIGWDRVKKTNPNWSGYALGGIGGQILEYDETAKAWLAVTPPTDNQLNDVKAISETDAWAVGAADAHGATIIHWDGKHWQRWYQKDPPLPATNLQTVDFLSPTNGWAAGDPLVAGAPAILLHWDGYRWAQSRFEAPINVRPNALRLLNVTDGGTRDFGWVVSSTGNAEAKYDYFNGYWSANHSCGGPSLTLRGLSLSGSGDASQIDAWAVGRNNENALNHEYFFSFASGCSGSNAWQAVAAPPDCLLDPVNNVPASQITDLYGIRMLTDTVSGLWGFASGQYNANRASAYQYNGASWASIFCQAKDSLVNPSQFNTTDIVKESGIGWFGGFYTIPSGRKVAYMAYSDSTYPLAWTGVPFPINGRNIIDRAVTSISMASDTMGWAVGERDDPDQVGMIYQYPYPTFTISTQPATLAVRPGTPAVFQVGINSIGSSMSVTLSSTPSGSITAGFSASPIDPSMTSTLTYTVPLGTPPGKYVIPIRGNTTIHSGDNDIPIQRTTYVTVVVTDHPITSVVPDHGPAGTVVTIQGVNLGSDPGAGNRSSATNHVILAGQQMPDASVLSWSPTAINVQVPDSLALFPRGPATDRVMVTTGGFDSNDTLSFQVENHIATVSKSVGATAITVTLTGTGFGTDPATFGDPTLYNTDFEHVTLNNVMVPYVQIKSWSNNTIVFEVPTVPALSLSSIFVTSNGYDSNAVNIDLNVKTETFLPLVKR